MSRHRLMYMHTHKDMLNHMHTHTHKYPIIITTVWLRMPLTGYKIATSFFLKFCCALTPTRTNIQTHYSIICISGFQCVWIINSQNKEMITNQDWGHTWHGSEQTYSYIIWQTNSNFPFSYAVLRRTAVFVYSIIYCTLTIPYFHLIIKYNFFSFSKGAKQEKIDTVANLWIHQSQVPAPELTKYWMCLLLGCV